MEPARLLALYDEDQRRPPAITGMRREEEDGAVRYVNLLGHGGVVLHTKLTEATADRAIETQIAAFEALGQDFEWKLFAHDDPADLRQRLEERGFEVGTEEAILVLDLESLPDRLREPSSLEVRRVFDLEHVLAVQEEEADDEHEWMADQLREELREAPEGIAFYVGYDGDAAVATGWIRLVQGSLFASLWGGATLRSHRRRGYYAALLQARLAEAARVGSRFVTVDAGSMSKPILLGCGFRELTLSWPCTWKAGLSGSPASV